MPHRGEGFVVLLRTVLLQLQCQTVVIAETFVPGSISWTYTHVLNSAGNRSRANQAGHFPSKCEQMYTIVCPA